MQSRNQTEWHMNNDTRTHAHTVRTQARLRKDTITHMHVDGYTRMHAYTQNMYMHACTRVRAHTQTHTVKHTSTR